MKTSREQFEEWFAANMFIGSKCIVDAATKRRMLRAWKASRQCIDVGGGDRVTITCQHGGEVLLRDITKIEIVEYKGA